MSQVPFTSKEVSSILSLALTVRHLNYARSTIYSTLIALSSTSSSSFQKKIISSDEDDDEKEISTNVLYNSLLTPSRQTALEYALYDLQECTRTLYDQVNSLWWNPFFLSLLTLPQMDDDPNNNTTENSVQARIRKINNIFLRTEDISLIHKYFKQRKYNINKEWPLTIPLTYLSTSLLTSTSEGGGLTKDNSLHQIQRDIERDIFRINDETFIGSETGYKVVLENIQELCNRYSKLYIVKDSPTTSASAVSKIDNLNISFNDGISNHISDNTVSPISSSPVAIPTNAPSLRSASSSSSSFLHHPIQSYLAQRIISYSNRTTSGYDSYEMVNKLFIPTVIQHKPFTFLSSPLSSSMNKPSVPPPPPLSSSSSFLPLLLVPDSSAAPPIQITIDTGPYQIYHSSNSIIMNNNNNIEEDNYYDNETITKHAIDNLFTYLRNHPIRSNANASTKTIYTDNNSTEYSSLLQYTSSAWNCGIRIHIEATTVYKLVYETQQYASISTASSTSSSIASTEDVVTLGRIKATYHRMIGINLDNIYKYLMDDHDTIDDPSSIAMMDNLIDNIGPGGYVTVDIFE